MEKHEYHIEEYSPGYKRWFSIAVTDSEKTALKEVRKLKRRNGNYYRCTHNGMVCGEEERRDK